VIIGNNITLSDVAAGTGTWSSSNTSIASVVSSTGVVTGVSAGTITITYTVDNGCGAATATYGVSVTTSRPGGNTTSITLEGGKSLMLYPNPTTGDFTIESPEAGTFTITTLEGKTAAKIALTQGKNAINMPKELAAGIYMCRYAGSGGSKVVIRLVYEP
jgi:hypothetical protein